MIILTRLGNHIYATVILQGTATDVHVNPNFDLAGHDTTASGISWTLYSLAEHPEYQQKCQAEVDQLLEGRESDDIQW